MIASHNTKILMVPDFGVNAEDEAMAALKRTIDKIPLFTAEIADLRKVVIDEHPGEELKDSKVIELAAHKLEELANDKSIIWEKQDDFVDDPLLDCYLDDADIDCSGFEDENDFMEYDKEAPTREGDALVDSCNGPFSTRLISDEDLKITKDVLEKAFSRRFSIRKTVTSHEELDVDEPDALVVFGKSVMLAGGVKDKPILFINPAYDSEWPWKKQFYAERDASSDYLSRYFEELNKPENTEVLWEGSEVRRRPKPTLHYGLFTDSDNYHYSEFRDRYVNMAMIDDRLSDTGQLAKAICEFAEGDMEFPLFDLYRMDKEAFWTSKYPEICRFDEPVDLGYTTVLGLVRGVPMVNVQSGIKLLVADRSYPILLEGIRDRRSLTVLRDAVEKAVEKLPQRKRILIVPHYFTPYNAPNVIELRDCLQGMGYYVAVFVAGNTLEQSQRGIERRCKKKPFDLIVTMETGCMLASRIMNTPRVFVNPDWGAWEWMKRSLGEDKEQYCIRGIDNSGPFWAYYLNADEIAQARKMTERSYIRRGEKGIFAGFSEDAIESPRLTEEHRKRFHSCCYIPSFRTDTEAGIRTLSDHINKIMKIDED